MNVPTWIILVLGGDPSRARYFWHDAKKGRRVWMTGNRTAMEMISCTTRRCRYEVIHLSFSLRLLGLAVPLDWDQQIRLINLLTTSQESEKLTTWKVWTIISKLASLDVFFRYPVGHFFGVSAHPEAEEWKSGIISHQHSESGVEIGAIPLAWYGPASQLQTERETASTGKRMNLLLTQTRQS